MSRYCHIPPKSSIPAGGESLGEKVRLQCLSMEAHFFPWEQENLTWDKTTTLGMCHFNLMSLVDSSDSCSKARRDLCVFQLEFIIFPGEAITRYLLGIFLSFFGGVGHTNRAQDLFLALYSGIITGRSRVPYGMQEI